MNLPFVILLGVGQTGLKVQKVYQKVQNCVHTNISFSEIAQMTFTSDIQLEEKTGEISEIHVISGIWSLNFSNLLTQIYFDSFNYENGIIALFPKPISDVLNIQLDITDIHLFTLEILSIDGKIILKQTIKNRSVIQKINLEALPQGIYLCRITDNISY